MLTKHIYKLPYMYPTEAMPSFLPNPSLVAAMFYEDAYVKRMIERKKKQFD